MRRFEYVGGGSEKFWEIGRHGAEVTVRFGRMGTSGQTQLKDLGTEAAATAHVDRLVAEKAKKGYVEREATAAPAAVPPAPKAAAPAAGPGADGGVAEAGSATPDETTFALPSAWARRAEPFRGLRPAPTLVLDPRAVGSEADELRRRSHVAVRQILDHRSSDSGLVRRADLHMGTASGLLRRSRQEDDPLGAAVHVMALCHLSPWHERERRAEVLADDLVLRHGAVFAAETAARLATLTVTTDRGAIAAGSGHADQWIEPAPPNELHPYPVEPVSRRLRAHLAMADDGTYADVVRTLAGLRREPLAVRVVTSYLAPTEQAWVEQDIAALPHLNQAGMPWPMLVASATTAGQVQSVLSATQAWHVARRHELLYSIVANLGTDAAGPLVALFDLSMDGATKKRLLRLVSALPTDEAFGALVDRIDQKYVSPVVIEAMGRYPARAVRLLAGRAAGTDGTARACKDLLRGHLASNPGLKERVAADLDDRAAGALDSIDAATATVPAADPSGVPRLLLAPPWQGRKGPPAQAVVSGLTAPAGLALRWVAGEQQEWARTPGHGWVQHQQASDWKAAVARAVDPSSRHQYGSLDVLASAPPDLVRPHLARFTPLYTWDALPALRRILGRLGEDAVDFVLRVVMTRPTTLAPALLPVEGAEVAARMSDWLVRSKSLRPLARAWLERHPDAAARDLVPAALGKPGRGRSAAEAGLRLLDQAGHRDTIRAAAGGHGEEARRAIEAALDVDPLERLPAKLPALPAWLDPAHLPQVLLPGRQRALPPAAVANICTMLALSRPGETYAGVDVVKQATDPASLAEMAWGLLERWQGAGFPARESWVLDGLGLVGDDETVRRLAPLIRAWPGDGAHARAVAALDVLSAIGTDVALMHLHGIAEKAGFKGLRAKAREKMDEVADSLGLTAEQLADRLVPDLGLDRDGSMVLDYGGRRFDVGFDEQLKPVVADEDGSRRKVLPRPSAKDDHGLATAAYARFNGLKKDVKVIAADQIRRFERAMVLNRRWTAHEQRTLFVDHPLLWHLARRLVWATFGPAGAVTGSFRVAEDRTLADEHDEELEIGGDTTVGIAHPLHLGDHLGTWSDLFADYEILQPFPQLARDTWRLTAHERRSTVLTRLAGASIGTGRILGLAHRGWERGPVMDGGVSGVVQRPVAGGSVVVIDLDPGVIAGAPMEWKEQKVTGVWISDGPVEWGRAGGHRPFSVLDDISASELLRDLEHLRG